MLYNYSKLGGIKWIRKNWKFFVSLTNRRFEMDIRNIQKTGNMHYVYLPTKWCKKHNINSNSKVSVSSDPQGGLSISPQFPEKKEKHLKLEIDEKNKDLIMKLIVACYINPTTSFKISLGKEFDFSELLSEKVLAGGLDLIEMDGNHVSYETTLSVTNPDALLKTMVRKIKNMLLVKTGSGLKDLIKKYEDEIDKSHFLIDKAVISSFSLSSLETPLKPVDLFYISIISQNLEGLADHIVLLEDSGKLFLKKIIDIIERLLTILEDIDDKEKFDYKVALDFAKLALEIDDIKVKDLQTYDKKRIKKDLVNISEVLVDWAITKEIEK